MICCLIHSLGPGHPCPWVLFFQCLVRVCQHFIFVLAQNWPREHHVEQIHLHDVRVHLLRWSVTSLIPWLFSRISNQSRVFRLLQERSLDDLLLGHLHLFLLYRILHSLSLMKCSWLSLELRFHHHVVHLQSFLQF